MGNDKFSPADLHGPIKEIFENIYMVSGTIKIPFPLPWWVSRNMVIIKEGRDLTLVNSMRLSEEGLGELKKLGEIKNTLRLASFHGRDDPFYKDRFNTTAYSIKGQIYARGFNPKATDQDAYFKSDIELDHGSEFPIPGAQIFRFASGLSGEGLLHLSRDGGIVISGDSMQNCHAVDQYYNPLGKFLSKLFGLIKPCNIGPGWFKLNKPQISDVRKLLDLDFENVLPVHGDPVLGSAKDGFRMAIDRLK